MSRVMLAQPCIYRVFVESKAMKHSGAWSVAPDLRREERMRCSANGMKKASKSRKDLLARAVGVPFAHNL